MKKLFTAIVLTVSATAFAACPVYSPYGCTQTIGGKQLCGCGR
jgi:hypothetical protein